MYERARVCKKTPLCAFSAQDAYKKTRRTVRIGAGKKSEEVNAPNTGNALVGFYFVKILRATRGTSI